MTKTRPIVLAVDLPIKIDDLAPIVELAAATGSTVHLLHVAAPEPAFVGYDAPGGIHDQQQRNDQLTSEHAALQVVVDSLGQQGVDAIAQVIIGQTVDVITTTADSLDASFIVLIGHRHGLAHRLVLGSVANRLLKSTKRPVLVLPDRSSGPARLQTFELDHPDATRAINDVSLFLSGLGI